MGDILGAGGCRPGDRAIRVERNTVAAVAVRLSRLGRDGNVEFIQAGFERDIGDTGIESHISCIAWRIDLHAIIGLITFRAARTGWTNIP